MYRFAYQVISNPAFVLDLKYTSTQPEIHINLKYSTFAVIYEWMGRQIGKRAAFTKFSILAGTLRMHSTLVLQN